VLDPKHLYVNYVMLLTLTFDLKVMHVWHGGSHIIDYISVQYHLCKCHTSWDIRSQIWKFDLTVTLTLTFKVIQTLLTYYTWARLYTCQIPSWYLKGFPRYSCPKFIHITMGKEYLPRVLTEYSPEHHQKQMDYFSAPSTPTLKTLFKSVKPFLKYSP
jgi:hypothetical protein